MQTFLPYKDFYLSANVLDKKRLWKQVVEAHQIIDVLEGKRVGWANHPAVRMWVGHKSALKIYFNVFLHIAKEKHKINTKYEPYPDSTRSIRFPWWLGKKRFHKAMRSRLIEKDRSFYLPLFPKDEGYNDGKYLWPDMDTKTFKTI